MREIPRGERAVESLEKTEQNKDGLKCPKKM